MAPRENPKNAGLSAVGKSASFAIGSSLIKPDKKMTGIFFGSTTGTTESVAARIAERLGVPEEDVVGAMDAVSTPVSLYEPVYTDGGDPLTVMDQVRDVKNTDEQWLESIALRQAMQGLSERERHILALRFYDGRTQMEVAGSLGISQAQVSRLEKNALSAIRRAISVS